MNTIKRSLLFAILITVLMACSESNNSNPITTSTQSGHSQSGSLIAQRIQPSDTGAGINEEEAKVDYNFVVSPANAAERRDILMVFLPGSGASPGSEHAVTLTSFVAEEIHLSAISLRYINYSTSDSPVPLSGTVNVSCAGDDACFAQHRGETVFGEGITYADGTNTYDHPERHVDVANSVVGRLASQLDYLAHQQASESNPDPDYWRQFLIQDERSPYVVPHLGNVYPDWSKIIISGHSQGGGSAPLLAMNISPDNPMLQVVILSAPTDFKPDLSPASWIESPSATPMNRFWGFTHMADIPLGTLTRQNWAAMGGPDAGGVGGPDNNEEADIGDGSGDPMGRQRLVLSSPTDPVGAHTMTVDGSLPQIREVWRYLFSANGQH